MHCLCRHSAHKTTLVKDRGDILLHLLSDYDSCLSSEECLGAPSRASLKWVKNFSVEDPFFRVLSHICFYDEGAQCRWEWKGSEYRHRILKKKSRLAKSRVPGRGLHRPMQECVQMWLPVDSEMRDKDCVTISQPCLGLSQWSTKRCKVIRFLWSWFIFGSSLVCIWVFNHFSSEQRGCFTACLCGL